MKRKVKKYKEAKVCAPRKHKQQIQDKNESGTDRVHAENDGWRVR